MTIYDFPENDDDDDFVISDLPKTVVHGTEDDEQVLPPGLLPDVRGIFEEASDDLGFRALQERIRRVIQSVPVPLENVVSVEAEVAEGVGTAGGAEMVVVSDSPKTVYPSPEERRERLRGWLAIAVVAIFGLYVVLSAVGLMTDTMTSEDVRSFGLIVLPTVTAVLAFYFASPDR